MVEIKEPTVNCDVVARIVVPAEPETRIELAGNDVTPVPPLTTGAIPVRLLSPIQVSEIA